MRVSKPSYATSARVATISPAESGVSAALALAAAAVWLERRLENRPEFPLGLLLGELTVLATVGLNFLVLVWGGGFVGVGSALAYFGSFYRLPFLG